MHIMNPAIRQDSGGIFAYNHKRSETIYNDGRIIHLLRI